MSYPQDEMFDLEMFLLCGTDGASSQQFKHISRLTLFNLKLDFIQGTFIDSNNPSKPPDT